MKHSLIYNGKEFNISILQYIKFTKLEQNITILYTIINISKSPNIEVMSITKYRKIIFLMKNNSEKLTYLK